MSSSPQVQQSEATARAAGAQVSAMRSQYCRTLSVSYSNGYTGVDSLGRSAVAPWTTTQDYVNNWALRFSVSWTLFNGFSREASYVSAAVQHDVAKASAADTRRQANALSPQQRPATST